MDRLNSLMSRLCGRLRLALLVAAIYVVSIALVTGADAKSDTGSKPARKTEKQAGKNKLTGAELYSIHCNRCHAERYATERTDAQWKSILMHMQVRAQLPGKDAKEILKYLQENN